MAYYDSFLVINKSPRDTYKDQLQEIVNQLFDNAPTYYEDVEEEKEIGSLEFQPIDVRVNNLVDAKTGQRVNDDFKKLIFRDIHYMPVLGTRYRFNNNIWITFSTDNVKTDTASIYVRRCNNTMNMQDKFGNIHKEPCYIDYSITETQIFKEYSIDIARGRIVVWCQLNEYTKNININDRYIFGNDAYKVRFRTKYDKRNTYDDNSTHLLYLQLEYDNIAEDDNIELGIANYKEYNYKIETISNIKDVIGSNNNISIKLLLDNKEIIEDYNITWESTDNNIATITNEGDYELKSLGNCQFICTLLNKKDVQAVINVEVIKKNIITINGNIIYPNINYLKLNAIQEYTVFEYINNEPTNTKFDIKAYNVPKEYYILTKKDNGFIVKNLKISEVPLKIVCTNLKDNTFVELYIELGGLF